MQTPRMLSTVRTAAPVLTDAGVGVGVGVLVLAASWTGAGPPWISSPRPLDAVAVGLIGVVAGALALRRRYPLAVLVVLNAVVLAWAAGRYPGRVVLLAPLIACYTLAAARGWRWGLAGAVVTALSALVAIRVAFGAAQPAGRSGIAVWMAATAGAAGTAVGYYQALLAATRAQLAREAQTREEQARRRAVEERLRIARELHDVFGHTMATISVQAGVVPQAQLPAPQVAAFIDRPAASGGLELDELAVLVEMDRLGPDVLDTAPGGLPAGPPVPGEVDPVAWCPGELADEMPSALAMATATERTGCCWPAS